MCARIDLEVDNLIRKDFEGFVGMKNIYLNSKQQVVFEYKQEENFLFLLEHDKSIPYLGNVQECTPSPSDTLVCLP